MRYTRYDYKKKKGDNFILWLIGIIAFSICIGMLFYNTFLKEKTIVDTDNNIKEAVVEASNDSEMNFGIIQCGVFKDRVNAETTLNSINSESTGFIIEEDGNFKLMYGIYKLEDAEEKSKALTAASISNFRIKCSLEGNDKEKKAEGEIIDAYIKVTNKLTEKDVKSVDTTEFKEWVNSIANSIENPTEEFTFLVGNINELPDEYKKENQKDSLIYIYNIIKKYRE